MATKYFDTVEDNETGKPVAGATVKVYLDGAVIDGSGAQVTSGTLATIYSDDGVTTIDQATSPLTADGFGYFEFYTNETEVALEISYGGAAKKAISDVSIVGGTVNSDVTTLAIRVDNHDTLLGYAANSTDLGTFTGSTITDNTDLQGALQELETAVEATSGTISVEDDDIEIVNPATIFDFVGSGVTVTDLGSQRAQISIPSGASTSQTDEGISFLIESPSEKDYKLVVNAPHGGTITSITSVSASGTCTATFKINTTALGGTANSVSSTEQTQAHASANAFSAGDDIVLTVSSNTSCVDASFTIKYTRTLA